MPMATYQNLPQNGSFAQRRDGVSALRDRIAEQPHQAASIVTILFWIVNLTFGGFSFGDGLYLSQLLLVPFLAWKLLTRSNGRILFGLAGSVAMIAVMAGLALAAGNTGSERFVPEFFKTVLLALGAFILWGEFKWADIAILARIFPLAALAVVAFVFVTGQGDYYGGEGRFGVPWWGAPNTTAFVLSIAIALWAHDMQIRNATIRKTSDKALVLGFQSIVLLGLVATVVYTDSQGGEIATAVILLRHIGIRLRYFMYLLPLALIAFWAIGIEIPELIGSGRPIIWATLLEEQFDSSYNHWLFGFGPGSIDFKPWFTARVLSAHSMFVEIIYNWGVVVGVGFIAALVRYARHLSNTPLPRVNRIFMEAAFTGLIAGFFFDTYVMAAQLSWLGACVLAVGGILPKTAR